MWQATKAFHAINFAFIGVLASSALTPWLLAQDTLLRWSIGAAFVAAMLLLVVWCARVPAKRWVKIGFALAVLAYLTSASALVAGGWNDDITANAHTVTLLVVLLVLLGLSSYNRRDQAVAD